MCRISTEEAPRVLDITFKTKVQHPVLVTSHCELPLLSFISTSAAEEKVCSQIADSRLQTFWTRMLFTVTLILFHYNHSLHNKAWCLLTPQKVASELFLKHFTWMISQMWDFYIMPKIFFIFYLWLWNEIWWSSRLHIFPDLSSTIHFPFPALFNFVAPYYMVITSRAD